MKNKIEKHTPGPWEVERSSNPKNGTNWRDIVSLSGQFSPSYVGEALEKDAHLIAAAPDLLEALKQLANISTAKEGSVAFGVVADAWAVIAKAEGRQ